MPTYRQTNTPVPPGISYTIEVWAEHGGEIELHLATIYPLSVAIAAFEAARLKWSTDEITRRDPARIVRKRERPPRASAAPASSLP